jgi:hypothetical protein
MARSTRKSATQEIAEALNTPVNLNWCDVAEELGVTIPDLQERFATKLNDATVFTWDTIPVEHQSVIDAIARDLESEASVRRLESAKPLPEATEQPLEPPILEEKPQSKRKGKKSSALTQRKSSGLKNSDENSQRLASTDLQVKEVLHARKGQKSGARLATIELLAEDSTYRPCPERCDRINCVWRSVVNIDEFLSQILKQQPPNKGTPPKSSPFTEADEQYLLEVLTECRVKLDSALATAQGYSQQLPDLATALSDALTGIHQAAAIVIESETYLDS